MKNLFSLLLLLLSLFATAKAQTYDQTRANIPLPNSKELISSQNPKKSRKNGTHITVAQPMDMESIMHTAESKPVTEYGLTSLIFNNFSNETIGSVNYFDLPPMDFSSSNEYALNFRIAYSYAANHEDAMSILISTNGGKSWSSLYSESGEALAITTPRTEWFIPGPWDWQVKSIDLSGYKGKVMIRFRFVNDAGHHLYLDDIHVNSSAIVAQAYK
jgi:hypothetical protein